MKFMLIMRATEESVEANRNTDFEEIINKMGAYNEELLNAGVMVGGDGLSDDLSTAFVVDFATEPPTVTDGPYGEIHELFNGFWMLEVATREEAIEWARRCPMAPGSKLEVRRVTDETDFAAFADNEYIQKGKGWREQAEGR
jgi:hypothetical protein